MRFSTWRSALVAVTACALLAPATASATSSTAEIEASTKAGVTYLKTLQETNGSIPGFGGDWSLTSFAAAGTAAANVKKTESSASARTWYRELVGNTTTWPESSKAPATEFEKAVLVAYAAGIDPARVSQTQNLIAQVIARYQTANPGYYGEPSVFEGTLFGLLALAETQTREGVERVPQVLLEQSVAVVRANQHTDGGWNFERVEGSEEGVKSAAEVDTTGTAMAALCSAGVKSTDGAIVKGEEYLESQLISASGSLGSEANTDSNAWAVEGLKACGINPQEAAFTTAAKKTPIDFLISQQVSGGGFRTTTGTSANEYSSQDAVRALAGSGFTAVPPVPSGELPQWEFETSFSASKSVASPLTLVINSAGSALKPCSVSVAPGEATTTLEVVLSAAETSSTPTGCVTSFKSEGQAITQINGNPSAPAPNWDVSIDGGAEARATPATSIHLGDTIYLRLAPTTPPSPPSVVTGIASSVLSTSATLNATVDPNGGEVTECKFEWGKTTAYEEKPASCSSSPGSGSSQVAVSAAITGLASNTAYHFRISATNAGGTSKGSDQTLTSASPPHVYQNGARLAEGEPFPTIEWGTIKLTNASVGEVECHTAAGGYLENPTGGGAAVGEVEAFAPYDCVAEACTSQGGKIKVIAEKLPWPVEVIEEATSIFRDKTTGVNLTVDCEKVSSTLFHGAWRPETVSGSTIGSKPSSIEFGEGSGELESGVGGGKASGKLNIEGFGKEQLVAVRSP